MLLREIKAIYHQELDARYGRDETTSFFYLLIEEFLGQERFILAKTPDYMVTQQEKDMLFKALARLRDNVPIQYVLGKAHFMGMDLEVGPSVLIPRPETEDLVRWVIDDMKARRVVVPQILDIGTGSGAIALALAKNLPNTLVSALDISEAALIQARRNAYVQRLPVHFRAGDILSFRENTPRYDVIVSNPPYIRESEKSEIMEHVKAYEPASALFVPDNDPLMFYRAIAEFARGSLYPDGNLYLEINQYLGNETLAEIRRHGFRSVELRKDIFGNFRMLKAGGLEPASE